MSRFIRTISQSLSALAVFSMVCTSVAVASTTTTVPASTTATTATATVAPTSTTDSSTAITAAASATNSDVSQVDGPLSDVPTGHWAYDAVAQLVKDGLIKGYPDGLFKGNRPMTRYEAAVLAYRAVDQIEAQITAGQAVLQADIDAANKLIAAYGKELKAVEAHVDKLQKQADATNAQLAATTAVANATAATVRRSQVHVSMYVRAFNYSQNISANNGPLPVTVGGTGAPSGATYVAPGAAIPQYTGASPGGSGIQGPTAYNGGQYALGTVGPTTYTGTQSATYVANSYSGTPTGGGLAWGTQPNSGQSQNTGVIGNQNHGIGFEYMQLGFGGNPDDRTQWFISLKSTYTFVANNYLPSLSPSYCNSAFIGNAAATGGAPAACSSSNVSVANDDSQVAGLFKLYDAWYQYTTPGGIYAKVGKLSMNEGPKYYLTGWAVSDYGNGANLGYRNAVFNVQGGYMYDDPAASSSLLYGVPTSQQALWAEADYSFAHGTSTIGATYTAYAGYKQTLWDPYAVNCLATAPSTYYKVVGSNGVTVAVPTTAANPIAPNANTGATAQNTKSNFPGPVTIPYTAAGTYTTGACNAAANALGPNFLAGGGNYVPIVYGQNGTPSSAGSGTTLSGPNAGLPVTGAYVSNGAGAQYPNLDTIGLYFIENRGKIHLTAEGTERLGNDPYTLSRWQGAYTVFFQLDYGAGPITHPGIKGKGDFQLGGFEDGFNSLTEAMSYYTSNVPWTMFTKDPAGYAFLWTGYKYYLTDTSWVALFGAHLGLLPNQIIPAGSASCPGCAITGDSRNAIWGELGLTF